MQQQLASATPLDIVRWVEERFGDSCLAAVSLQSPVLPHLVATHAPSVPIVFIDTGYHFEVTLRYRVTLERRLGHPIRTIRAKIDNDDRWRFDTQGCCHERKVEPLEEALHGRQAFLSGVRRSDHSGRSQAPVLSWDTHFSAYRIQPLVAMTDEEISEYLERHLLPRHPLYHHGYPSIGCWPCTSPVKDGEHSRAGRWRESNQTECGINNPHI